MNKSELVNFVAERAELTKKDSQKVVDTILNGIKEGLARGDKLQLRGLGSFEVRQRAPRVGRKIATGERVEIPARKIPVFIPGKVLKRLVNKK